MVYPGFRGVSMKKELIDEVEEFIRKAPKGKRYRSITTFCEEAIRLRLEDLYPRKKEPAP